MPLIGSVRSWPTGADTRGATGGGGGWVTGGGARISGAGGGGAWLGLGGAGRTCTISAHRENRHVSCCYTHASCYCVPGWVRHIINRIKTQERIFFFLTLIRQNETRNTFFL